MAERRWVNRYQPQTLQIAVFLLYFNAIGGLLFGTIYGDLGPLLGLAALAGSGAAGYGIANELKWGYGLGVGLAALEVLLFLRYGLTDLLGGFGLIPFMFAVALVALLIHPQSREYQRIWFK
jgi:hypothetical protein